MMTLDTVPPGGHVYILKLRSQGAILRRLLDFGFIPGSEIAVMRSAPLGDPMTVKVGDDTIAVRREEASRIEVCVHG